MVDGIKYVRVILRGSVYVRENKERIMKFEFEIGGERRRMLGRSILGCWAV